MAKNTYKTNTFKKPKKKSSKNGGSGSKFFNDKRFHLSVGFFFLLASLFFFTSFLSYLFTGKADQSVVESIGETGLFQSGLEAVNWLGVYGAWFGHLFIFKWFGLASFLIPPLLFVIGFRITLKKTLVPLGSTFIFTLFFLFWTSLLMGYILLASEGISEWGMLSGGIGVALAEYAQSLVGWGTLLILIFSLLVFIIYFFNVTQLLGFGKPHEEAETDASDDVKSDDSELLPTDEEIEWKKAHEVEAVKKEINLETASEESIEQPQKNEDHEDEDITLDLDVQSDRANLQENNKAEKKEEPEFTIEEEKVVEKLGNSVENYDPTLDLSEYKYPTLELLNKYDEGDIQVTKEELEENKDKIIETLINFKIGISSIKATIGPTVTLYEIVPEAGIKISKIKNLEDDIALSLAALGIRIIAPIPGKGTIGIEVPNKKRELVAVRSVLSTEKFLKSEMELPIILGKTISNEVFLTDLTKMPHLLMAGATGQGKSVGINVILSSLLYKKHPSQLKLILVDPKKVELSLFNKIERHFLAELPGSEEPIITDHKQVVNTLNSLCIEMDNRYNLLKDAGTRNLKEYNRKFVQRRLNPEKGHRYLPYIVLVVDELADLMMTAGKEVEGPIARLAQLARAIGIHLVIATQRPSVNVITGIIKANFPTRMSFRVTSVVDSRTILDMKGAERLVGMGDMLLSQGSDIIRLQCPFVDTEEIERICEFIGEQRGYESAYLLPEYIDESGEGSKTVDLDDRDALFEEAAKLIVMHQQGSTSLIQRKLKLGYNRAGRLIDQLEAAGIVGPFEGSKAREVLVQDPYALEQLLNELNEEKDL